MWRIRSAVESSLVFAVTTCRPSRNTVARSHSANTSSSRWLTNMIATPRSRRRRTIVNSRSTSWADSDAVGSSRIRARASTDRALAISISCWSAMDRPRTGAPTSNSTSSSANSAWAALRMARQLMEPARPEGAWPMNTFSATLRSGNRRGSWWTTAMPRARDWAGPWMRAGVPSRRMVPASGWWTPARILTSVLLPAPFSPTSAWISPERRSSDTSVRAAVAPNRLLMPRNSTRGGCGSATGASEVTDGASVTTRPPRAGIRLAPPGGADPADLDPHPDELPDHVLRAPRRR